jgi:hypothetical protein
MRGDQLTRQWRVIRAIEASPGGPTVAEVANFPSTLEALQAAGFPLYTERVEKANRWAFIDTFKFKIRPPIAVYSVIPQNATFTEARTAAWATII